MDIFFGLLSVIVAGVFQGSFILPMTLTRRWRWEHTWAAFSLFGMLLFNGMITWAVSPHVLQMYSAAAPSFIFKLALMGAGWGVGAILFGLGMDQLGMALGYPIIMGLVAGLGATVPLLLFLFNQLASPKGGLILGGTAIVIVGIILCSMAGSRKQQSGTAKIKGLGAGLTVAISAGVLSCLPNVALAYVMKVMVVERGISSLPASMGNAVWLLFFVAGFLVNFLYCFYRMRKNRNVGALWNGEAARNLFLTALMGLMWVGSFYLYGFGAAKLGKWGAAVGWPIFISLSIVVGCGWGIWKGEWTEAPLRARRLLHVGIAVLLFSVVMIASSNLL